jgi:hypothetical protein
VSAAVAITGPHLAIAYFVGNDPPAVIGEALQGCAGKTVVVFFETVNPQGAFLSIQGKVVSSEADYVTVDNSNGASGTNRLVIPFRHVLYVQYQF